MNDRRGSMLIVALGILTLMSILAVTFVNLMRLEREASKNYLDSVGAKFLARSGAARVSAEMRRAIGDDPTTAGAARWLYENTGGSPDYTTPLEQSKRPSFQGIMGNTYTNGIDRYKVKVVDATGQMNLNDPQERLPAMLDALGDAIAGTRGRNPVSPARFAGETGGRAIVAFRDTFEGQQFSSKFQLIELIGEENYKVLRDYVTTQSWIDPNAVAATVGQNPFSSPYQIAPQERSPININTAPAEVLQAVIQGVGGRFFYHLPADDIESNRKKLDAASTNYSWDKVEEEHSYDAIPVLVYVEGIPQSGAALIANAIVNRRAGQPFKSYADWEEFVDTQVRNGWLPDPNACRVATSYDRSKLPASFQNVINAVRKRGDFAGVYRAAARSALKSNFNPSFINAYFNPDQAALKMSVNSAGSTDYSPYTIDKGSLVRYYDPNLDGPKGPIGKAGTKSRTGGSSGAAFDPNDPAALANPLNQVVTQSVDWCFSSRGVFEIVSLGEILVKKKDGPLTFTTMGGETVEGDIVAQEKIRTVVRIMDVVSHRSQLDFERNRGDLVPDPSLDLVQTYPENPMFWDKTDKNIANRGGQADPYSGYVTVGTRRQISGLLDPAWANFGIPTFQALYDRGKGSFDGKGQHQNLRDEYTPEMANKQSITTAAGKPAWAYAFGTPYYNSNFVLKKGQLYPDGHNMTILGWWRKKRSAETGSKFLWYPAAWPRTNSDRNKQGHSYNGSAAQAAAMTTGNVHALRGGVEFWYKPDFDWSYSAKGGGQEPTELVCGILYASHVMENPNNRDSNKKTTGTQMFVLRNSSGDLRVTRLWFELVGKGKNNEFPWSFQDPQTGNILQGLGAYKQLYAQTADETKVPWPPKEIAEVDPTGTNYVGGSPLFEKEVFARIDTIVPYNELKNWKAHEWHHIAIRWDDTANSPADAIKIYVDGDGNKMVSPPHTIPTTAPTDAKDKLFVRLNEVPVAMGAEEPRPWDQFMVGGIERLQRKRGGMFKFTEGENEFTMLPMNGTIDDIRVYNGVQNAGVNPPSRYWGGALGATYTQRFDLASKFIGGASELQIASLNWSIYMPKRFAGQKLTNPGRVDITVRAAGQENAGTAAGEQPVMPGGAPAYNSSDDPSSVSLLHPGTSEPYRLPKGNTIYYDMNLFSADYKSRNVAAPVVDEVSLIYFLPKEEIILKERVYD